MTILNWTGPIVDKKRVPDYEQAFMKAALSGESNEKAFNAFEDMFGDPPKKGVPYWLVRLAVYYGALAVGHERAKRGPMSGTDRAMFNMVIRQDEKAFRNNPVLWHHMYLHDVEPIEFDGREVVS